MGYVLVISTQNASNKGGAIVAPHISTHIGSLLLPMLFEHKTEHKETCDGVLLYER